jgi:hypothetical protein
MRNVLLILGLAAWGIAGFFAFFFQTITIEQTRVPGNPPDWVGASVTAPNPASGPTAAGFAIAGGLCFLAAALVHHTRPDAVARFGRTAQMERDAAASIAALEERRGDGS